MVILRELITVLGFDVDEKGINSATDAFFQLQAQAFSVTQAWDQTVGRVQQWIDTTVTAGDEADKMAKRLGVTAQEMQQLQFVADRSGIALATLTNGMRSLQRRAAEVIRGNKEFGDGFRTLGVSVRDASGRLKDPLQLLLDVADAMQKVSNAGERLALAMRVAGDGGASLLPLFLEGSEGINALRERFTLLGAELDEGAVKASEELKDLATDLGVAFSGLARRLAVELFPVIREVRLAYLEWFIANRELIDDGIKVFASAITGFIESINMMLKALGAVAAWIAENARFLLTLAAVIAGVKLLAVTINILLIPNLLMAVKGFVLMGFAAARAAIIAAAPYVALAALLTGIALVIEDIFVFVSGGKSAIGELSDAFLTAASQPDAHWMVKTLSFILELIREATLAIDDFFKLVFDQALAGNGIVDGFVKTLNMALEGVGEMFEGLLAQVFGRSVARLLRLITKALNPIANLFGFAEEGGFRGFAERLGTDLAEAWDKATRDTPLVMQSDGRMGPLPAGIDPRSPLAQQITQGNVTVNVTVPAGSDAQSIANASRDAVRTEVASQNATALRNLQSSVVR